MDWYKPTKELVKLGFTRYQIAKNRKIINAKNYGFTDFSMEIRELLNEVENSGMTIRQKIDFVLNNLLPL